MLSATMNIIGHTSLLNMKVGGSQTQGSGSNLRDQQPQKNSSSSQNKNNASTASRTNNTTKTSSQNLKSTIVLEEDEKAIS